MVYLSHNIKTIGFNAFEGCNSLEEIHYAGSEDDFGAIVGSNTVLYEELYSKLRFNSTP